MIRHLIALLTFAAVALQAGQAFAQGTFPAPQPGQDTASDACTSGLDRLREEAEARGKLVRTASERHAPPDEACKLIENFRRSEIKMIKYIEANSAKCGISLELSDRLMAGHKNTEVTLKKVCGVAQQMRRSIPAGPVGDFDDIETGQNRL